MKLKRLRIHRFRNVAPCDLVFSDGINVVLGTNGSGKTTLLDFISRALRSNMADEREPYDFEIEIALTGGSLRGHVWSAEPSTVPHLEGAAPMPPALAAAIEGRRDPWPEFDFTVPWPGGDGDQRVFRRGSSVVVEGGRPPSPSMDLRAFRRSMGLISLAVLVSAQGSDEWFGTGGLDGAHRFDEALDLFRAVTAGASETAAESPQFCPRVWGITYANGPATWAVREGVVARALTTSLKTVFRDHAQEVIIPHGHLSFLAEAIRLFGFKSAEARLDLVEKIAHDGGAFQIALANLRFWFERHDGSGLRDRDLSFGQKRLLAFLYYLDASPEFVIADELVNGLHHAWIAECMAAIGERQSFLTSQNPLLLDYLTPASTEEARESFIVCRMESVAGRDRRVWRNLTDDEAAMFFSAYRVGVEDVGQILRTRGLW